MQRFIFLISFISIFDSALSQQETKLLRFPTIHGSTVIFTYAGDLYSVETAGGKAKKLTNHIGHEMFAKISPDGKLLAFTGQYDGNTEIYVMPVSGGKPTRLTYTATLSRDDVADRMGPNNIALAWTQDSKYIIFRSRCYTFNDYIGKLFKISVNGGMPEEIPISDGGFCSWSPDGKKLAFNWVFREFRTWKYYKGGMADEIRIFDSHNGTIEKITNNNAQDVFPMWIQNSIFYISDRDRTMNLFSFDLSTRKETKITDFKEYDIKFPSHNENQIVFENAGQIWVYNAETNKTTQVKIIIESDFILGREKLTDVTNTLSNITISPHARRITGSAHGDIFTIAAEEGVNRNLTISSDAHDRNPQWSPDGKSIAFISDKSGEYEIWTIASNGAKEAEQLTNLKSGYIFRMEWSPDGKRIVWNDKELRLRSIELSTKKVTEIAQSDVWEYNEFNFSPDGRYLAYTNPEISGMNTVKIFDFTDQKTYSVTDNWYRNSSPTFSKDGKYIFFASDRTFNANYNAIEWNAYYKNTEKIYFIPLNKSVRSPFIPKNLEETNYVSDDVKNSVSGTNNKNEPVVIDFNRINERIIELPVINANYGNISVVDNKVYYIRYFSGENQFTLRMYDLDKKQETELGNDLAYELALSCKKMLITSKLKHYIIDLPVSKIELKDPIEIGALKIQIDYAEEWKQIYNEAWRQMRDFFYDPKMHGVDWEKIREKYAALLPYVNHRDDLTYLIGEMIGELNIGHAYINSGIRPQAEKIGTGLLGARFVKDASGYFKITEILQGANWDKDLRSPLTEPGAEVEIGNFIIAINGKSLKNIDNIFELLVGTVDVNIELKVNSTPSPDGARTIIVKPLASESDLIYYNWVQNNIKKVDKATEGQVGYIHIPDMLTNGFDKFTTLFYPQTRKKALIIDDRGNGGGNVSPIIIERLRRELVYFGLARNVKTPSFNPQQMHLGPKVLLLNKYSASDGDLFPYQFKYYKIGKTIGERSWGGVVGIRGSLPFVDGSDLRKPEFAKYSVDGNEWVIEGYGVDPDIVVENNPHDEFKGIDAQLDKAIQVIMEELKTNPKKIHDKPDYPNKTK